MSRRVVTIVATAFIAVASSASSAGGAEFRVEPAGAIRATSIGKVRFRGGEINLECNLVLTGNLLRGFVKVNGERMGEITRVQWENCVGGQIANTLNLPWPVTYFWILGELPAAVTRIDFEIVRFEVMLSIFGGVIRCLYGEGTSLGAWSVLEGRNPYIMSVIESEPERLVPVNEEVSSEVCPATITVTGSFRLNAQQRLTRI